MKKLIIGLLLLANSAFGQKFDVKEYQQIDLKLKVYKEQKRTGFLFQVVGAYIVYQSMKQQGNEQCALFAVGSASIFYGASIRMDAFKKEILVK